MATGATVGRCKLDSTCLSGCAWVERISLQFLPHRNTYSKKKKNMFGAVRGFIADVLNVFSSFILTRMSRMLCCRDNGDAGRAAAALADNTAALLLFCCCCHFVSVCVCVCWCACRRMSVCERCRFQGSKSNLEWLDGGTGGFYFLEIKGIVLKCFTFNSLEVHF